MVAVEIQGMKGYFEDFRPAPLSHPLALAAAAVIRRPPIETVEGELAYNDTLFVMGGFGGWPQEDSRYDGLRCRNDVYKTKDGGEQRTLGKSRGIRLPRSQQHYFVAVSQPS